MRKVSSKQRRVSKAKFDQLEDRVCEDFIKLKESQFKVVTNTWITEREFQILALVGINASNRWDSTFQRTIQHGIPTVIWKMISNKQAIGAVLLLLRHYTQKGRGTSPFTRQFPNNCAIFDLQTVVL